MIENHVQAINREIALVLEPAGFRTRGPAFMRWHPEVVHIIGLHRSLSSDRHRLKLTVDLGVWVLSLAPIRAGIPDRPRLAHAHWRERLAILDRGNDAWWVVRTPAEAAGCALDIVEALRTVALPALNRLVTARQILELWLSGSSPGLDPAQRRYLIAKLQEQGT